MRQCFIHFSNILHYLRIFFAYITKSFYFQEGFQFSWDYFYCTKLRAHTNYITFFFSVRSSSRYNKHLHLVSKNQTTISSWLCVESGILCWLTENVFCDKYDTFRWSRGRRKGLIVLTEKCVHFTRVPHLVEHIYTFFSIGGKGKQVARDDIIN